MSTEHMELFVCITGLILMAVFLFIMVAIDMKAIIHKRFDTLEQLLRDREKEGKK